MRYDIVSMVPDFCDAFLGEADVAGGLPYVERLERRVLDYSLESLRAVDQYLAVLHPHSKQLPDQHVTNVILAAGCYLGEVVRRNARTPYQWVNYGAFIQSRPDLASVITEGIGTSAVLVFRGTGMTMPINKVVRFLIEGPDNSTHYYATGELAASNPRTPNGAAFYEGSAVK